MVTMRTRSCLALLAALALAACGDDAPSDASDTSVEDTSDTGVDATDAGGDTTDDAGDTTLDAADAEDTADAVQPRPWPAPDAHPPNAGPGGPVRSFSEDELYANCATLDGGERDTSDHHNLLVMVDGYLLMPWAPEYGQGGLTYWDITDPCAPVEVGTGFSPAMRETHSIGFWPDGDRITAVVNGMEALPFDGGALFWDVSDSTAPEPGAHVIVPGFFYPDAYARVGLSVFFQAPYVYVAGADNGIWIIDATNVDEPVYVDQYVFDPVLRAGQVAAIGNLLIVTAAEGARTALLDISDPTQPQPIPGGDFEMLDAEGVPREAYFTNTNNGYIWYARKEGGGGVVAYDIHDPTNPVRAGDYHSPGNGGYVFVKDEYAFVGESNFAAIYDLTDLDAIEQIAIMNLEGDLDTVTPIGNVAMLSVDDDAIRDEGTAVAPWQTEPDTRAPEVTWVWPPDGADDLAVTSRIGLTFNEMVDVRSAWEGSVRLYEDGTDSTLTRVDCWFSVQEAIVNVAPQEPLQPGTTYRLEVPAGGIADFNGNRIETPFEMTFTTAGDAQ